METTKEYSKFLEGKLETNWDLCPICGCKLENFPTIVRYEGVDIELIDGCENCGVTWTTHAIVSTNTNFIYKEKP